MSRLYKVRIDGQPRDGILSMWGGTDYYTIAGSVTEAEVKALDFYNFTQVNKPIVDSDGSLCCDNAIKPLVKSVELVSDNLVL